MLNRKPELLHFTVLFFLVFLTYQESVNNYFLADDALWLMQAKKAEQTVFGFFQPVGGFLRPMVTFTYFAIYKFFNLNPAPYYLFCVVLHAVNCIVLYYFCLEFFRAVRGTEEKSLAFLCATLFSVLYSHCEAVIWIGALGDSFLLLFCLLSFIFFMKSLSIGFLSLYSLTSIISYILALFSKESAFVFPVLLLTFCVVFKKEKYRHVIPFVLIFLFYLIFYKTANPDAFFVGIANIFPVLLALFRAFGFLGFTFVGFSQNSQWIFSEVNNQLSLTKILFQVMAIGGLLFNVYFYLLNNAYRFRFSPNNRTMAAAYFIFFIAIAYFPIALYIMPEQFQSEVSQKSLRYFYFPSAGFCILLALCLSSLFKYCHSFIIKSMFILSILVVNIIPVYQTEWSYNFFGRTRKHILERVIDLHKGYKNRPYIFLIDYPVQFVVQLQTFTFLPLFRLYEKNVSFSIKETAYDKAKNLNLNRVCFFEWTNVTFVDKTVEYVHAIEKQRQLERLKAYRKI